MATSRREEEEQARVLGPCCGMVTPDLDGVAAILRVGEGPQSRYQYLDARQAAFLGRRLLDAAMAEAARQGEE